MPQHQLLDAQRVGAGASMGMSMSPPRLSLEACIHRVRAPCSCLRQREQVCAGPSASPRSAATVRDGILSSRRYAFAISTRGLIGRLF
jgi:hypothetical protein